MIEKLKNCLEYFVNLFSSISHPYLDCITNNKQVVWIEINDEGVEVCFPWEQHYDYQPFLSIPFVEIDNIIGFLDKKWEEVLKERKIKLEEKEKNKMFCISKKRYEKLLSFEEKNKF